MSEVQHPDVGVFQHHVVGKSLRESFPWRPRYRNLFNEKLAQISDISGNGNTAVAGSYA